VGSVAEDGLLHVALGPDNVSFSDFVSEGWRRERHNQGAPMLDESKGWKTFIAKGIRFK